MLAGDIGYAVIDTATTEGTRSTIICSEQVPCHVSVKQARLLLRKNIEAI
jgi:hypothetical protein